MERFGLGEAFSLDYNRGEAHRGLSLDEVLRRTANAALLLNVMGFLEDEEILGRAPAASSSTSIPVSGRCGGNWGCTICSAGMMRS